MHTSTTRTADAPMMSHAEGVALDRCSRLFGGMAQPEPLDSERAQRVITRASAGGQGLAYATGCLVPHEVLAGANRFLGNAVDAAEPQAA